LLIRAKILTAKILTGGQSLPFGLARNFGLNRFAVVL
jgi:hypothetical protein